MTPKRKAWWNQLFIWLLGWDQSVISLFSLIFLLPGRWLYNDGCLIPGIPTLSIPPSFHKRALADTSASITVVAKNELFLFLFHVYVNEHLWPCVRSYSRGLEGVGKLNTEYLPSLLAEVGQNISHAIIQDINILFLSLDSLLPSPRGFQPCSSTSHIVLIKEWLPRLGSSLALACIYTYKEPHWKPVFHVLIPMSTGS